MSKKFRNITALTIVAILALTVMVNPAPALAADNTFNLTVTHAINGKDLGLDKDLPVNVFINGSLAIRDFRFGEVVETSLPAGSYEVTVRLPDGTLLESMTIPYGYIPGGLDVDVTARLDGYGAPSLAVAASEAAAPTANTFDVTVEHNINGRSLGLPAKLPVNVYINGALAISNFEYGDKIQTALPAGEYLITVTLPDGTPLDSMTVGPVDIAAGADLVLKAKLTGNDVPFINVRVK